MRPAISIVTISYNQGRFLGECMDSVIAQRRAGVDRYVVVDPGSTDGSRELIGRRRQHIDAVIAEPDRGPADGLNKGFACAGGEILGYINADDRFAPGALEHARASFAAHPAADVLCGTIRLIDEHGHAFLRKRTADRFDVRRYIAGVCMVGQQATFFRRSAFERTAGFNAANRVNWDGELLVELALAGARFATTPRVLGEWRIYGDTVTGSPAYRARLGREFERIAADLARRGVQLHSARKQRVMRWLYRFNPARHVRYLVAR